MELHYQKLGRGSKALLAFHGIGQTGEGCFEPFQSVLGDQYTIYAFDLPFHGNSAVFYQESRWDNGDFPFLYEDWKAFLEQFLTANQITDFSVAGFSLGGRFALATLEIFPEKTENVYLIAPDGVREQFVYRLATGTRLGRVAFVRVLKWSGLLQRAASGLNKIGLLHASVLRVLLHMTSSGRSVLVQRAWLNFRELKYHGNLHQSLSGKVFVFIGKYDQLIKARDVAPLARLPDKCRVVILNAGHTTSVEHAALEIRRQGFL